MESTNIRTPRFMLVHSLAHLLIRRFELDAGYSGSSLRERIYCDENMAAILIYTATPDSEGTLGGLVELARPEDLGLGRMQSRRKEYVGSRMLDRKAFLEALRPRFVGLVPVDGRTRIEAGAQLVEDPDAPLPMPKLGHVTASAYVSPTLGHPVALGLLARGRERIGETVWALSPVHGQRLQVRVADPVFYDPEGGRQRG